MWPRARLAFLHQPSLHLPWGGWQPAPSQVQLRSTTPATTPSPEVILEKVTVKKPVKTEFVWKFPGEGPSSGCPLSHTSYQAEPDPSLKTRVRPGGCLWRAHPAARPAWAPRRCVPGLPGPGLHGTGFRSQPPLCLGLLSQAPGFLNSTSSAVAAWNSHAFGYKMSSSSAGIPL